MQFHVVIQDEVDLEILYETLLYFLTEHSPDEMKITVEYDSSNVCDLTDAPEESSPTNTNADNENTEQSQQQESFHLEIQDQVDLGVLHETLLNLMTEHSPMATKITVEFDSTTMCDSKDSDENSEE
jgi:hypothetical protein